ncbi:glycoside hydrolase family 18 chitinase [Streptoalloteichus hindustanus]|uniref:chitinase n=1 Tax=Streptoalloteichus hindustanus TaxID=2017 RepID=A0A1M4YZ24_STRHI|nr:glycoside hydrolase family 18 chitinase [Streptoalloteichus hindustanus]SHF11059.1 chitinase [Streptoalloteichus hindustanus]
MFRRRWHTCFLFVAAVALVFGGVTAPAHGAAGPTATFTKASDWGSGYTGAITITNGGSTALNGWNVEFDLPSGTSVASYWDALMTRTGDHYKFANREYNGNVAPGASVSFGFIGNGSGVPVKCRLNGAPCEGGTPDDTEPPTVPTNLAVTGTTSTSVSLSWSPSTDNVGVTVYEVVRNGTVTGASKSTQYSETGLTPNTEYSYQVRALDAKGNRSELSTAVTARTRPGDGPGDTEPPSVPTNLKVTAATSDSVSLSWTASTDNVGVTLYEIVRNGAKTGVSKGTEYRESGLTPDTEYSYQVRALDARGNQSALSTAVTARTQPSDDPGPGPGSYQKVGYFPQWGIYGRKFFIKDLDTNGAAKKLTHLNYSFENLHPTTYTCFATTKSVGSNPSDPNQGDGAGDSTADYVWPIDAAQSVDGVGDGGWAGAGPLKGNFNQLRKLKAKHPHLKVLVSLGGWTFSKFFSDAAATQENRERMVSSCIDMYIKGNLPKHYDMGGPGTAANIFDGIDVDWEWPGAEGHPGNHFGPADKQNFVLLLQEFRKQLDAYGSQVGRKFLLTAFTPADPAKISAGWDLPQVAKYLDLFNVQGYDFHGSGSDNSWEPKRTGHQANLYVDKDDPYSTHFSVETALQPYLDAKVDRRKLLVGIPFYGRGWQQVAAGGKQGEWQDANGAAPGDFPEEAGVRGYKNLATAVPGCTVHHDEQAVATFCHTGQGGQWWSFDDAWSIGKKTEYIKAKRYGGAMIWDLSGDTGTLMTALDNGLR